MHLDLPSLEWILFLVYLVNAVLTGLLAWSGRSFFGAWYWVLAQTMLAIGAFLLVTRSWPGVPSWVPIVAGNGFYLGSSLPFAHAIWLFRRSTRFPFWTYGLVPVMVLTLASVVPWPFSERVQVVSAWAVLGSLFPGFLLITRVAPAYRLANALTALPFGVSAAASLVRLAWNHVDPNTLEYYQQSGWNEVYVIGSLFVSTVTSFGYFMMTGVRAEQDLQAKDKEIDGQNRKLIESNRAKDLFFSIIAHDLRGPIGGAARYARKHLLGKMTGLEAKYNEVEILASALEKTNEFLEKLLWWSRAQQNDWTPTRVIVDLGSVLDQSVSLIRSAADLKEIRIEVAPGPYPQPLADPESVQLILGNLLSNAVKFSLPGHVVRLKVEEEYGLCRIVVEDEGVGMDPATTDRLFRIEDKLTTHGTSGERGSGMGLLLARSLAERNRGGITIESQPGVGTTATLWLPTPGLEGSGK